MLLRNLQCYHFFWDTVYIRLGSAYMYVCVCWRVCCILGVWRRLSAGVMVDLLTTAVPQRRWMKRPLTLCSWYETTLPPLSRTVYVLLVACPRQSESIALTFHATRLLALPGPRATVSAGGRAGCYQVI